MLIRRSIRRYKVLFLYREKFVAGLGPQQNDDFRQCACGPSLLNGRPTLAMPRAAGDKSDDLSRQNLPAGLPGRPAPALMALLACCRNLAEAGSCTSTNPAFPLMARSPYRAVKPMPERMTPMLSPDGPRPRERRPKSMGRRRRAGAVGTNRCSTPCRMDMSLLGGAHRRSSA